MDRLRFHLETNLSKYIDHDTNIGKEKSESKDTKRNNEPKVNIEIREFTGP